MAKVLLIDSSGRGHALADLFVRTNPEVEVLYVPGCGAIEHPRIRCFQDLRMAEVAPIAELAISEGVDFIFVANTAALVDGFVDSFRKRGLRAIGPDQQAARLEASKIFTKQLCSRHGVPVADWAAFDAVDEAIKYVQELPYQVVVKADGLCRGDGTFVCNSADDAVAAIEKLMSCGHCGVAGEQLLIERRLTGKEFSFFALLDGEGGCQSLPMAVDYPKAEDGNRGPTCGGIGSFSPHPMENQALEKQVRRQLLEPLLTALKSEALNYNGIIYLGCMLDEDGDIHLLEINVRMGDPEAQACLPRIEADFVAVCEAIISGNVDDAPLQLNDRFFCNVVATQGRTRQISKGRNKGWYTGWPYGRFGLNYPITGLDLVDPTQCRVFLGETFNHPEKGLVSRGGRVLSIVGIGDNLEEAANNAYRNVQRIEFDGIRYRSDIGRLMPWNLELEGHEV